MVEQLGQEAAPAERGSALAGDEARFAAARRDYESGEGRLAAIAARHGISRGALRWRVRRELWTRPSGNRPVDRPMILSRLFRVLDMQVRDLELEMNAMSAENRRSSEREVAVLGRLAANLEALSKLEAKVQRTVKPVTEREIKHLREKLRLQIENLVRAR